MVKALIVDDEQHCIDRLERLLRSSTHNIQMITHCKTIAEAKKQIAKTTPDILFLDVQLGNETGFDLLTQLNRMDFEVIFTTSYDKYALKAIKFSALDYLLKPIENADLENALLKLRQQKSLKDTSKKMDVLFHNFKAHNASSKRIAIPTVEGLTMMDTKEIIRFQSDANYTHIHTLSRKKITASKTIKYFEDILDDNMFFRVHKSHLVNLDHIETYTKGKGGHITLSDGIQIEVAVRRKDELLKKLRT